MSNTRKAKWTEAQVTAANAEALLGEFWAEREADAARKVITGRLAADLEARGHEPGLIAVMEQASMDLGTDYWAGMYQDLTAR